MAVVFIDLAGFTALTEAHGDNEAADLSERFTAMTAAELDASDRLVKTIGDAVLLVSDDAGSVVALLRRVLPRYAEAERFPIVRVGANLGPVVVRNGDVFGATVNVAARIAGQAGGGQVLVTEPIATAARAADVGVRDPGQLWLRNVSEPVTVYDLDFGMETRSVAVDPVCRMRIAASCGAGHLRYAEVDYPFCSLACAAAFAADPARFVVV